MAPLGQVDGGHLRRSILRLAWPVILANFLQTLTTTVDVLLVGHLPNGEVAVAAVGLGSQILFLAYAAVFAISTGTMALVARAVGAKDGPSANHALRVSLALGLLFALPVALTGILFGRTVVGIFGAAADVEDEAAAYTSLVFLGIPFLYTNFLATAGMRGSGDTRTPLYIGGLVNAVNVFLNVNLIYGYMGFPALGVRGAAIGTTLSYLVGALAFLRLLLRPGRVPTLRGKALGAPLDPAMARRILRLGSPVAVEQLILQVGFTLWVILVTGFGSTALAAHMVGMRVNLLAFMPGFGYSLAATALVGQNLGAEKPFLAERSALESAKLALVTMGLMAVGFFVAAEGLARLFIPDPAVITKAALWIRIYALGLPAFGIFFSLDGALRGAGDVLWPTAISAASFFAIRLTLSWQLGHIVFGDVVWVWVPMVIDFYARTLMVFWRFSAGVWKTVTV